MIIRKVNKKDVKDLSEIIKTARVLEDYYGEYDKRALAKMITKKGFVFLVAEEDGKVVGFINFEVEKDIGRIFLDTIAVHKKFRGKGIASVLYAEMEKHIARLKIKRLFMIVRDYNKEMNEMAKKRGCNLSCKLNYWAKNY